MQHLNSRRTFIPTTRNISNMGTTVTYSTNSMNSSNATSINAFNSGLMQSGAVSTTGTGTQTYFDPTTQTMVSAYNPSTTTSTLGYSTAIPTTVSAYNPSATTQTWGYNPNMQTSISASQFNQMPTGTTTMNTGFSQGRRDLIVQPSVDISETSSDVIVTAYCPNVNSDDLSLSVTENSVTVSGHTWTGNSTALLNRTVALPTSVRAESCDANLNSGVLEIRLPKHDKDTRRRTTLGRNDITTTSTTK